MSKALKPGRELDALVAEHVMGWEPQTDISALTDAGYPPNGEDWHAITGFSKDEVNICWYPRYSTDIAAAWEIVASLTGFNTLGGKIFKLTFDGHFCCTLGDSYAHGETAPHAICLAALKGVGYEEK